MSTGDISLVAGCHRKIVVKQSFEKYVYIYILLSFLISFFQTKDLHSRIGRNAAKQHSPYSKTVPADAMHDSKIECKTISFSEAKYQTYRNTTNTYKTHKQKYSMDKKISMLKTMTIFENCFLTPYTTEI